MRRVACLAVLALAGCGERRQPASEAITLHSVAVTLPADEQPFPRGPHADTLDANCTACHSASMILVQPPLKPEQWQAEVTKMREVYKAPIAEQDVPAILTGLAALNAKPAGGTAKP